MATGKKADAVTFTTLPIPSFTLTLPGDTATVTVGPGGPAAEQGVTVTPNVDGFVTVIYAGGIDYPILYCQAYDDGQPVGGVEFIPLSYI